MTRMHVQLPEVSVGFARTQHLGRSHVNSKLVISLLVLLGVVFIAIGIVYFAQPASGLPSFFPGHAGSSASAADRHHHHAKHGIAAVVLGLGAWTLAWFQTGPRTEQTAA